MLAILAAVPLAIGLGCGTRGHQRPKPQPTFEDLLKKFTAAPPYLCSDQGEDFSDLEYQVFERARDAVARGLNGSSGPDQAHGGPRARAIGALEKLQRLSAAANKGWPEEKRFHFEVLNLPPALAVKMTFRNRATFAFFASFQNRATSTRSDRWQYVGAEDDHLFKPGEGMLDWLELTPLERGPARNPRFLAEFGTLGCGNGQAVGYYAYEWNPQSEEALDEFIKLEGNPSQPGLTTDKPEEEFPAVGEPQTHGPLLSLPYCWHSPLDTWDHPNLCAVNSYDISGDRVHFTGTVFSRPDLVPIARVIEHAQARDYPAVLAYCGSPTVAQLIVRDIPPYLSGVAGLEIKRASASRKRVEIGMDHIFQFDVEQRVDRWLVVGFAVK